MLQSHLRSKIDFMRWPEKILHTNAPQMHISGGHQSEIASLKAIFKIKVDMYDSEFAMTKQN